MAIVFGNMITYGLRGKVGNMFVFRSVGGKTVVSRAPGKQDKANETAAQRNTRTTFREATLWAKNIIRDPEKKSYYKKLANKWKLTNAYTAAIKEYMRNTHAKTENHSRPSMQQPAGESQSRRTLATWNPFDIMVRNSTIGVDRFKIERSAPTDLSCALSATRYEGNFAQRFIFIIKCLHCTSKFVYTKIHGYNPQLQ